MKSWLTIARPGNGNAGPPTSLADTNAPNNKSHATAIFLISVNSVQIIASRYFPPRISNV